MKFEIKRLEDEGYVVEVDTPLPDHVVSIEWQNVGNGVVQLLVEFEDGETFFHSKVKKVVKPAIPVKERDHVDWVVNDIGELGVKVGDEYYFMYKGSSLIYKNPEGMKVRPIGKREFGECCHPINYKDPTKIGTVSLDDSDEWEDLPGSNHPDAV